MTAIQIFHRARALGLQVETDAGDLLVWPASKCPAAFADELRANKSALLEWLSRPPCPGHGAVPPADLPLATSCTRPSVHDRELVIFYVRRQTGDRPGQLSAWLSRREAEYFDGHGAAWDCGVLAFAAARDCAVWQLNRTEVEVVTLLAGFEETAKHFPGQ